MSFHNNKKAYRQFWKLIKYAPLSGIIVLFWKASCRSVRDCDFLSDGIVEITLKKKREHADTVPPRDSLSFELK